MTLWIGSGAILKRSPVETNFLSGLFSPLTSAKACEKNVAFFMTLWIGSRAILKRSPVETNFLSGLFSPLTSAKACEKSSRWLWKEK